MEGKDFVIYLLLYAVGMSYFILLTYRDPTLFSMTVAYALMAVISLLALLHTKSDEPFYQDLNREQILWGLFAVVILLVVGAFFNGLFGGANLLRSVLYYVKPSAYLSVELGASSIVFAFFSDMVYQVCAVATAEELLKFGFITELEKRYHYWWIVLIPIALWAGYHMIQSYPNALYAIPAFISGVVLLLELKHTKNIMVLILSHGTYNTVCIAAEYMRNPPELPLFPPHFGSSDILLLGLAACWITFFFAPGIRRK